MRNWPTDEEIENGRQQQHWHSDDKDANGEWTTSAIQRYGGCTTCRTPFLEDCTCNERV